MTLQEKMDIMNVRLEMNRLSFNYRYPGHFAEMRKKCAIVCRNPRALRVIARTFCKDARAERCAVQVEFDLLEAVRNQLTLKQLMIRQLEEKCRAQQLSLSACPSNETDRIASLVRTLEKGGEQSVILLFLNFQLCYHIIPHGDTPAFIFLREMRNCMVFASTISVLDLETALGIAYKGNSVLSPCVDGITVAGDIPYTLPEIQKACRIPDEPAGSA